MHVFYTGEPLPQDKESVFWLNVQESLPKPDANKAGVNRLQLNSRSRIKLFFRPAQDIKAHYQAINDYGITVEGEAVPTY